MLELFLPSLDSLFSSLSIPAELCLALDYEGLVLVDLSLILKANGPHHPKVGIGLLPFIL